ncbi:MAG: type I-C CRISPR-associated protein Cas8c/Csd1 [Syntrophobacterales bacterium]|nr:type I-C CRISPR-associated protein Cas8c/Csd1 [Syntrophobacterales bacterium]
MLSELLEYADRLQGDGGFAPVGYKVFGRASPIRWILHLHPETGELLGEPEATEIGHKARPVRQRSGKVSESNVKPYLLVDEARYVLGIAEPGREKEVEMQHQAFLDLLERAWEKTKLKDLEIIHHALKEKVNRSELAARIKPNDVVTCLVGGPPYPFEKPEVQSFWRSFLEQEFGSGLPGHCSVCGENRALIQTLPLEVVVLGQKCQVTSFNCSAFTSFGKSQTVNASLCLRCGMLAAQALDHLVKDDRHTTVLMRDLSRGAGGSPLQNHLAVYWLKKPQTAVVDDQEHDLLTLISAPLAEVAATPDIEPSLALLEKFVKIPWSGSETVLPENAFYLAVLSANKGRLVVREWIAVSLAELNQRLGTYLAALRLIGPQGEHPQAVTIPQIAVALRNAQDRKAGIVDLSPNLVRGLLRTAYLGTPPPPGLLEAAVKRLRTPRGRELNPINKQPAPFPVLAAVLKLVLTYGKKEADTMEQLNPSYPDPAYLCGRLLAVLEEAQRRAATGKLNTTLVDRFYGAAATGPAAAFAPLLKLAQTAHLPKIRRENRGYGKLNDLLTEIMTSMQAAGGFPRTLSLLEQGRFALGFYHQRAALAAPQKPEAE